MYRLIERLTKAPAPVQPARETFHFIHLELIVTYMASIEHVYTVTQSKFGIQEEQTKRDDTYASQGSGEMAGK